jgi:hypothetical protein
LPCPLSTDTDDEEEKITFIFSSLDVDRAAEQVEGSAARVHGTHTRKEDAEGRERFVWELHHKLPDDDWLQFAQFAVLAQAHEKLRPDSPSDPGWLETGIHVAPKAKSSRGGLLWRHLQRTFAARLGIPNEAAEHQFMRALELARPKALEVLSHPRLQTIRRGLQIAPEVQQSPPQPPTGRIHGSRPEYKTMDRHYRG